MHFIHRAMLFVAGFAMAGAAQASAPARTSPSTADYDRAARFLATGQDRYMTGAAVAPHWLPDGDHFWYRSATGAGTARFVLVDARSGRRQPAFDHDAVAKALSAALGKPVAADRLPFKLFRLDKGALQAVADGKLWTCSGQPVTCAGVPAPADNPTEVPSPDGRWIAYAKDDNLWVRPTAGGEPFALTTDGGPNHGWAAPAGVNYMATTARIAGAPYTPAILWSPDSRRLVTHRLDERKVREIGLLQSVPLDGSIRPKLYNWRFPAPNDPDQPTVEPWVFDIAARHGTRIEVPAITYGLISPTEAHDVWWSPDGARLSLLTLDRYNKAMTLYAVDPDTGGARRLVSETGKTFVEAAGIGRQPMVRTLANGDIVWFSEREGDGRLYLYGPTGALKRTLWTGPGAISSIVRLDEAHDQAWVRANDREPGLDPYLSNLYRLDLKSGAVIRLTPEAGEHEVAANDDIVLGRSSDPMAPAELTGSVSPNGRWFVDTYSTVSTPPVSVLRAADGRLVATLERGDISALKAGGFTPPEPFTALAADGKTTLYGVIFRPSDFDPSRTYPVVDSIYPGPQSRRTPSSFAGAVFDGGNFAQAIAELGFVVVTVDGRGTPGRSKTFLDYSYGKLSNGGALEDHVAAIRAIAATRPWMDLDRVGIYGISGGGNATARAMFAYPDFYKVGVANAGNHDQRGYLALWGETYNGPDDGQNYAATANAALAKNLKGKLLLIHGDLDANVSPALTLQVVDALIKANKDFDMLIVPNRGHSWGDYATRVTWDYLVRNLMGATPPKEYLMPKPEP